MKKYKAPDDYKNIHFQITLSKDDADLIKQQRNKNPHFNFSRWVRDRIRESLVTEDFLKKEKQEYLNKAKQMDKALQLLKNNEESQ